MKYVSITFDDGRKDNYIYAYPILKKYNQTATLFCATGFIDGTWKPSEWKRQVSPMTIDELKKLDDEGWEIALHGDKHTTEVEDLEHAYEKMLRWGIGHIPYGFSMPNSRIEREKFETVIKAHLGRTISYIRQGRAVNTQKLSTKIQFGLYTYLHIQMAYNAFNAPSLNCLNCLDLKNLSSVVVRGNDSAKMIVSFVNQMPDNTWAILMLHSIEPDAKNKGPWCWSDSQFDKLCELLKRMEENNVCRVKTVKKVLEEI